MRILHHGYVCVLVGMNLGHPGNKECVPMFSPKNRCKDIPGKNLSQDNEINNG